MAKKKTISKLANAYTVLGVIAHRDNWQILQLLSVGEVRHKDLALHVRISRNNLYAHLKTLKGMGLIKIRKVSQSESWYSVEKNKLIPVMIGINILNDIMTHEYDELTLLG